MNGYLRGHALNERSRTQFEHLRTGEAAQAGKLTVSEKSGDIAQKSTFLDFQCKFPLLDLTR